MIHSLGHRTLTGSNPDGSTWTWEGDCALDDEADGCRMTTNPPPPPNPMYPQQTSWLMPADKTRAYDEAAIIAAAAADPLSVALIPDSAAGVMYAEVGGRLVATFCKPAGA